MKAKATMIAPSSENPPTPGNPYSAPKSSPSSFAKSYVTLAIGGGLVAATLLTGLWLYARSESAVDARDPSEREIFMDRRVPFPEPTGSSAAPVDANATGPAAP